MDVARNDQRKRVIEVNRLVLLEKLEANLLKHQQDYEEAMAGYKDELRKKIEEGYVNAKEQVERSYHRAVEEADALTPESISKRRDHIRFMEDIWIQMPVPKSFADDYRSAIDMVRWDVRDTLELSYAEFNCFVRDQWDWRDEFDTVTSNYSNKR